MREGNGMRGRLEQRANDEQRKNFVTVSTPFSVALSLGEVGS